MNKKPSDDDSDLDLEDSSSRKGKTKSGKEDKSKKVRNFKSYRNFKTIFLSYYFFRINPIQKTRKLMMEVKETMMKILRAVFRDRKIE